LKSLVARDGIGLHKLQCMPDVRTVINVWQSRRQVIALFGEVLIHNN